MNKMPVNFLFHDYETFGKNPALDKPAQFAAIRTDADFNIISEPSVFYCKPPADYLPQPEAVLITGITPQQALAEGDNEATFARHIHSLFTAANTCILGYNNIRFDDEVTRHLFYRNFYDPYDWSWRNGNSRWDLLDVLRACYALRPDGINWPENAEGFTDFRLECLTEANGIEHSNAHDAMADVHATIAMAKLIKRQQPRLFDWLFSHRHKNKLTALIDTVQMKPLVHVSGMLGGWRANTSWVAPIEWHPRQKNTVIVIDLAGDITPLLELESDNLRQRLYTRKKHLDGASPLPIKLVHLNKCPILAPASTLRPADAERINIDRQHCLDNLHTLRRHPELRDKLIVLFSDEASLSSTDNVDAQLYSNFFNDADRKAMDIIREKDPRHLPALSIQFTDPRLERLLFNYRARNFAGTLDEQEQRRWQAQRRSLFNDDYLQHYCQQLAALCQQYASDSKKLNLLHAVERYMQTILE